MRKAEQRLWDTMKRRAPEGLWMERVENYVSDGIPDLIVFADGGVVTFVELKAPTKPKRKTTPLLGKKEGLRVSQINWHEKAARKGVRVYTLIRAKDDPACISLVPGAESLGLNALPLSRVRRLSVAEDWPGVFAVLEGEAE